VGFQASSTRGPPDLGLRDDGLIGRIFALLQPLAHRPPFPVYYHDSSAGIDPCHPPSISVVRSQEVTSAPSASSPASVSPRSLQSPSFLPPPPLHPPMKPHTMPAPAETSIILVAFNSPVQVWCTLAGSRGHWYGHVRLPRCAGVGQWRSSSWWHMTPGAKGRVHRQVQCPGRRACRAVKGGARRGAMPRAEGPASRGGAHKAVMWHRGRGQSL
jgi:hypothetical protein